MKAQTWLSRLLIPGLVVVGMTVGVVSAQEVKMSDTGDYRDIPFSTITGAEETLRGYEGSVVLLVNTASKCGFTPQYEGLEAIYNKYKDRGFTVIGFPANNFMGQEPGSDEQIAQFCSLEYGVTFPMMSKISVKGKDQHPLYAYLTDSSPFPGKITWNFNKFLLDREGNVIARFGSRDEPESADVVSAIEAALTSD